jgi:predicted nucleic acid-binding protein
LILLDGSGLLTALDESQPLHADARRVLENESPPFLLSPFVLAELDYLILRRAGVERELDILRAVADRTCELVAFETADVSSSRNVVARHRDLAVGIADASIVVLAERFGTNRVLTLDERHLRSLRVGSKPFVVLPADERG